MKLGVLQALPPRVDELSPERLAHIRSMGFTGTGLPTSYSPEAITPDRARQIGSMFADAGLDLGIVDQPKVLDRARRGLGDGDKSGHAAAAALFAARRFGRA